MYFRNPQWRPEENPLRLYLKRIDWTEDHAMNVLQDHGGIISDNCVGIDDVANYAKAMMWIHSRRTEGKL